MVAGDGAGVGNEDIAGVATDIAQFSHGNLEIGNAGTRLQSQGPAGHGLVAAAIRKRGHGGENLGGAADAGDGTGGANAHVQGLGRQVQGLAGGRGHGAETTAARFHVRHQHIAGGIKGNAAVEGLQTIDVQGAAGQICQAQVAGVGHLGVHRQGVHMQAGTALGGEAEAVGDHHGTGIHVLDGTQAGESHGAAHDAAQVHVLDAGGGCQGGQCHAAAGAIQAGLYIQGREGALDGQVHAAGGGNQVGNLQVAVVGQAHPAAAGGLGIQAGGSQQEGGAVGGVPGDVALGPQHGGGRLQGRTLGEQGSGGSRQVQGARNGNGDLIQADVARAGAGGKAGVAGGHEVRIHIAGDATAAGCAGGHRQGGAMDGGAEGDVAGGGNRRHVGHPGLALHDQGAAGGEAQIGAGGGRNDGLAGV